jgi:hypothetical protein
MGKWNRFCYSLSVVILYFSTGVCNVPVAAESQDDDAVIEIEDSIFKQLPQSFYFSSGVGAWETEISIATNGSFTGKYHDSDRGDIGVGYSNGTVYISNFNGKFSQPQKVDAHSYSMNLEYIEVEKEPGVIYYENDIRYICSEPYGFDNADEFRIYLPGYVIDTLPEGFLPWAHINITTETVLPENYYGIYNVGGEEGFVGIQEDIAVPVSAYQGIFMKDDTFISLPLYTSYEPSGAIGIAHMVTTPSQDEYGYVECDVLQTMGEIYESDETYNIVSDTGISMKLTYYDGCITIEDNDVYEGKYEQVSNSGANMNPASIWLNIPTATTDENPSDAYIFNESDSRYLTEDEIAKCSLQEINYAKNEIYARHGRKFSSKELQDYFNTKLWYHGTIEPENFSEAFFNEYEKANVELLTDIEFKISPNGYQLDQ